MTGRGMKSKKEYSLKEGQSYIVSINMVVRAEKDVPEDEVYFERPVPADNRLTVLSHSTEVVETFP